MPHVRRQLGKLFQIPRRQDFGHVHLQALKGEMSMMIDRMNVPGTHQVEQHEIDAMPSRSDLEDDHVME